MPLTGPRWALWALRFVWFWFAIGWVGTLVTRGIPLLAASASRDPEAIGGLAAIVLMGGLLFWARPHLWPPVASKDAWAQSK